MSVIISNGPTSLSTVNGFYRVEAHNLSWFGTTNLALTTTRTIAVTFANAGNCQGVVLGLLTNSMTDREVVVKLQELVGAVWTDRASVTMSTTDIAGTCTSGTYQYRGEYVTPCVFGAPYAVDVAAGKWRFEISHGAGVGTWNLATSNGTAPFYATWCDNALSWNADDVLVCKDKVTVDATTSFGAVLGTGDAVNGIACVVCSNVAAPEIATVALLEWENPPAAAYTLTVKGKLVLGGLTGIRIGSEETSTCTISHASPGVVTKVGHGLAVGQLIAFRTTGTLPAPLDDTRGVYYYVESTPTADTFTVSATSGGAAIDTTSDGDGTHTLVWGNIPYAERAILDFVAAAAGTAAPSITQRTSNAYDWAGRNSLFAYGQIPRYMATQLTNDAVVGQAHLLVADAVDWVNGDTVVMTKQDVQGQGSYASYTVQGVAGADITLTGNVANYDRIAGGWVIRLDRCGVKIKNAVATVDNNLWTAANYQLQGVDVDTAVFRAAGSLSYQPHLAALDAACRSQYLIRDVVSWVTGAANGYFLVTPCVPPDGLLVERYYGWNRHATHSTTAFNKLGHVSGRFTLRDSVEAAIYGYHPGTDGALRKTFTGNYSHNMRAHATAAYGAFCICGTESQFTDNYVWGSAQDENVDSPSTGGAVGVGQLINPIEVARNHYDNCLCAVVFYPNTQRNAVDVDSEFGAEAANTVDIGFDSGCMPSYTFDSPTGALTLSEGNVPDMVEGFSVGFADYDDTATDDRRIYTLGKTQRTNAALADTTVHTAGGSAMRFEPTTAGETFEWAFDVPTGNIQTKTMVIAIWCKLNNAAYWAGTHEMPRLTVEYDGGTEVYAAAAQTTAWQLLSVTFTPATATGKITVTLSGQTDATGTDRYFYWDDASVFYPAGVALNLGGLDIWDAALPVTPPIATLASALDVWTASAAVDYGANTMGEKLKAAESKADDACALVLSK